MRYDILTGSLTERHSIKINRDKLKDNGQKAPLYPLQTSNAVIRHYTSSLTYYSLTTNIVSVHNDSTISPHNGQLSVTVC